MATGPTQIRDMEPGSRNLARRRCCHRAGHSARPALAVNSPASEVLPETYGAEHFHLLDAGFACSSVWISVFASKQL
jgi:hypothetical protein